MPRRFLLQCGPLSIEDHEGALLLPLFQKREAMADKTHQVQSHNLSVSLLSNIENRSAAINADTMESIQDLDTSYIGSSFTPFSRLPTELRLKIWSHCLEPQVINIWIYQCAPASPLHIQHSNEGIIVLTPKRIPLWNICHESRSWVHENNILMLHGDSPVPEWMNWNSELSGLNMSIHSALTMFDPAHDVLFLNRETPGDMRMDLPKLIVKLGHALISRVRYLGLRYEGFSSLVSSSLPYARWIKPFETLELVVVVGRDFEDGMVHLHSHILKRAYDEDHLGKENERWEMPNWRFIRTTKELKDAVKQGTIRGLEGFDAHELVPY